MAVYYALIALALIVITIIRRQAAHSYSNAPFPKGPTPIPYLGNLHQIPLTKSFLTFTSWSRSTSTSTPDGIVGLRFGPQSRVVILNKWTQVRDLFDSRGKGVIYSDRPRIRIGEYVIPPPGTDMHLAFARYGPKWRRARRTIVEFLSEKEMPGLLSIQDAEGTQMMWELLGLGDGGYETAGLTAWRPYVLRYFGAVILASVFGIRGKYSDERSKVGRFFSVQDEWAKIADPGQTPPIDVFPWLDHVPDFLTPWKGWRERAAAIKTEQSGVYRDLLAETQARVDSGRTDCFMGKVIVDQKAAVESGREKDIYTQLELDYIGGFLMEAGADTTATNFETFILAMAAYPELQKQAQEEIDRVFGQDEIPHTADGENLPFLRACLLETLRWRPPFPTLVPHANTADDVYQNNTIPKGTTVIANAWAISHDPEEFDDPDSFMPSRYLANRFGNRTKENEAESTRAGQEIDSAALNAAAEVSSSGRRQVYAFGAGRRVCAGQKMAENSSMMTMAKLIWSFEVVYGGDGKPDVDVRTAFKDGILIGPKLFPVRFVPRSEAKKDIIRKEWEKSDRLLSKFE